MTSIYTVFTAHKNWEVFFKKFYIKILEIENQMNEIKWSFKKNKNWKITTKKLECCRLLVGKDKKGKRKKCWNKNCFED